MKKKFTYQVAGFEYVGDEAFGDAWRQARAKATELHAAIYREVSKGDVVKKEVFVNGGCFLSIDRVTTDEVLIF